MLWSVVPSLVKAFVLPFSKHVTLWEKIPMALLQCLVWRPQDARSLPCLLCFLLLILSSTVSLDAQLKAVCVLVTFQARGRFLSCVLCSRTGQKTWLAGGELCDYSAQRRSRVNHLHYPCVATSSDLDKTLAEISQRLAWHLSNRIIWPRSNFLFCG